MKKIEAPKYVWVATYIMRGGSSGVSVFKARSHAREFVRKHVNPSLEHTIRKYVLEENSHG